MADTAAVQNSHLLESAQEMGTNTWLDTAARKSTRAHKQPNKLGWEESAEEEEDAPPAIATERRSTRVPKHKKMSDEDEDYNPSPATRHTKPKATKWRRTARVPKQRKMSEEEEEEEGEAALPPTDDGSARRGTRARKQPRKLHEEVEEKPRPAPKKPRVRTAVDQMIEDEKVADKSTKRLNTMTDKQMSTRINKMTDTHKLSDLINQLEECGRGGSAIHLQAQKRLEWAQGR